MAIVVVTNVILWNGQMKLLLLLREHIPSINTIQILQTFLFLCQFLINSIQFYSYGTRSHPKTSLRFPHFYFFYIIHFLFSFFTSIFLLSTHVSPALLLRSVRWKPPAVDVDLHRPTNHAPVLTDAEAHLTNETAGWGGACSVHCQPTTQSEKNNHWVQDGRAAVTGFPPLFREPVLLSQLIKKSR